MHDPAHFGVNQAQVHTDPPSVVHQVACLTWTPNLPEWGRDSGKRAQKVDFAKLEFPCEPIAVPCGDLKGDLAPIARTKQRVREGARFRNSPVLDPGWEKKDAGVRVRIREDWLLKGTLCGEMGLDLTFGFTFTPFGNISN